MSDGVTVRQLSMYNLTPSSTRRHGRWPANGGVKTARTGPGWPGRSAGVDCWLTGWLLVALAAGRWPLAGCAGCSGCRYCWLCHEHGRQDSAEAIGSERHALREQVRSDWELGLPDAV